MALEAQLREEQVRAHRRLARRRPAAGTNMRVLSSTSTSSICPGGSSCRSRQAGFSCTASCKKTHLRPVDHQESSVVLPLPEAPHTCWEKRHHVTPGG